MSRYDKKVDDVCIRKKIMKIVCEMIEWMQMGQRFVVDVLAWYDVIIIKQVEEHEKLCVWPNRVQHDI